MQDKTKEKDFFDSFSAAGAYDVFTPYGYRTLVKEYLKLIRFPIAQGIRVIDLGCGTGAFTQKFKELVTAPLNKRFAGSRARGAAPWQGEPDKDSSNRPIHGGGIFYGLDISIKSVSLGAQLAPDIRFCAGDIEHCCFKDESFDIVLFSGVLHHFSHFESCLREGFRVLKKGGCALSYDPHIKNPFMWLYRHPSSPFFSQKGKTENETLLSGPQVKAALEKVGFTNVITRGKSGVTFKYVASKGGRLLLPFYNILDILLGLSPLDSKYGAFLIGYGEKPAGTATHEKPLPLEKPQKR